MEKKTIKISSSILKPLIISFPIAFLLIFAVNHFGSFSYISYPKSESDWIVTSQTIADVVEFHTPYGTTQQYQNLGYTVGVVGNSLSEFFNYSNKVIIISTLQKVILNMC